MEKCDEWPVQKCTAEKKTVLKYTPETSCNPEPRELCYPSECQLVQVGIKHAIKDNLFIYCQETLCLNKTKTVIVSEPKEECELEPKKVCRHTTKMVPQLRSVKECVDVPKEVCATSRVNPEKKKYPTIQKWCYTPVEETAAPTTATSTTTSPGNRIRVKSF